MNHRETASKVISLEIEALQAMKNRISQEFDQAIDAILDMRGHVVVVGMGKSGIIGRKIAASLASTGTPAFFVHPAEAFHGDLGMIRSVDIALMISNSGETEELIRLLPFMQHQKNQVIAMTGNANSTLARNSNIVLDISVPREACYNNLAPTSSTTATLVMGDALTVVLASARQFQPEDFARFHPGGSLGRKLLARVCDAMQSRHLPICMPSANFCEVIQTVTQGRLGMAIVMDGHALCGLITDGDIRRAFAKGVPLQQLTANEFMTASPKTIFKGERLVDAEARMREQKIKDLIVLDEKQNVVGVLQIFDVDPLVKA